MGIRAEQWSHLAEGVARRVEGGLDGSVDAARSTRGRRKQTQRGPGASSDSGSQCARSSSAQGRRQQTQLSGQASAADEGKQLRKARPHDEESSKAAAGAETHNISGSVERGLQVTAWRVGVATRGIMTRASAPPNTARAKMAAFISTRDGDREVSKPRRSSLFTALGTIGGLASSHRPLRYLQGHTNTQHPVISRSLCSMYG